MRKKILIISSVLLFIVLVIGGGISYYQIQTEKLEKTHNEKLKLEKEEENKKKSELAKEANDWLMMMNQTHNFTEIGLAFLIVKMDAEKGEAGAIDRYQVISKKYLDMADSIMKEAPPDHEGLKKLKSSIIDLILHTTKAYNNWFRAHNSDDDFGKSQAENEIKKADDEFSALSSQLGELKAQLQSEYNNLD